jgi:pseudouridine-5'-phosphate glycosidase
LPYPDNVETALRLETAVQERGADPATIGIIAGKPIIGLSKEEIRHLATADPVRKVSWRDLPVVLARGEDGATTVAATMWLAHRAGIRVFATGGIGGVHRGAPFDVSADLEALTRVPMVVVCAGPKAILDLAATREVLETRGITVVGYQTDEMPAFYHASSGLPVDVRCDTPEAVAALVRARRDLDLPGAVLVTVPPPAEVALSPARIDPAIEAALQEAEARDLRSAAVTPFLLQRLATLTDGQTIHTNRALLTRNAGVAAEIAVACAA